MIWDGRISIIAMIFSILKVYILHLIQKVFKFPTLVRSEQFQVTINHKIARKQRKLGDNLLSGELNSLITFMTRLRKIVDDGVKIQKSNATLGRRKIWFTEHNNDFFRDT